MRSKLLVVCVLATLLIPFSTGCSIWRQVTRPELWGLTLLETWEYDSLRKSGQSHAEARQTIRQKRAAPPVSQESEADEVQDDLSTQTHD